MSARRDSDHLDIDLEKKGGETHHVEDINNGSDTSSGAPGVTGSSPDSRNIDEGYDPVFVKRTLRKVDWRLIPILAAMYCVSLIDRTNLSTARQANEVYMDKQLGTNKGSRYSIITLMFFVPYIILELPSQLGLKRFGAKYWLSTATLLWGVVTIGMGFVTTWYQLAALRAILGVFEAALFPGAAYLISCWYPRKQMATRNTIFYVTAAAVGSLFAPLAYAITLMHGMRGLSGWQWLFIWNGIITVIVALIAYVGIVDFPHNATHLTEEEKSLIITRIQRDRADAKPDPMTMEKIRRYSCDLKVWLFGFFFMSATVAAYSLAYFLPMILRTMGFNNFEQMTLGAPPSIWAILPSLGCAYFADRIKGVRALAVMFNAGCIIMGTAMYSQLPVSQKAARYVGVFFAVGGANANVPLVLSWAQTSIRAQSKRAFTAALIVAWGGLGGILASVVFIQKEYLKGYPTGIWFTIATSLTTIVLAFCLSMWMRWQNRRADRDGLVLENDVNFRYQP